MSDTNSNQNSSNNPASDDAAGLPDESDLPEDNGFEGTLESDEHAGLDTPLRTPVNLDPGFPEDDQGPVSQ